VDAQLLEALANDIMKEAMQLTIEYAIFHHDFMIPKLRFFGKILLLGPKAG
jgi:hypothetical protein